MYVSDGVDQGVGPQDDAGALGPLRAHQAVLAQQDFADVFGARDPNDRFPEKVGLEHVAMTLPARDVEVGALESVKWVKRLDPDTPSLTQPFSAT